jgi:hypothetical protein
MTTFTQQQVNDIVREAKEAAFKAADKFFKEKLGDRDQYACGFGFTKIYGVKGNTKLGKMFKAAGVEQNYERVFEIWNPSGYMCQNIDTLEEGARAAADVFRKYGFKAYGCSRLD